MNGHGESDRPVVPAKSTNAGQGQDYWSFLAEWMEGRGPAEENGEEAQDALPPAGPAKQVDRTQSRVGAGPARPEGLHSALDRVRQAALEDKGLR